MHPMILLLSRMAMASAALSTPVARYSRSYLRGMQAEEEARIQSYWIKEGVSFIENAIFDGAKQGLTSYTTEQIDCEMVTHLRRQLETSVSPPVGWFTLNNCNNIVTGIRKTIATEFPDSEILYDEDTHKYTLTWV